MWFPQSYLQSWCRRIKITLSILLLPHTKSKQIKPKYYWAYWSFNQSFSFFYGVLLGLQHFVKVWQIWQNSGDPRLPSILESGFQIPCALVRRLEIILKTSIRAAQGTFVYRKAFWFHGPETGHLKTPQKPSNLELVTGAACSQCCCRPLISYQTMWHCIPDLEWEIERHW